MTEERKIHDNADRHRQTEERKADRHKLSGYARTVKSKIISEIKTDTGMDVACAICYELKSRNSCCSVEMFSRETSLKWLTVAMPY